VRLLQDAQVGHWWAVAGLATLFVVKTVGLDRIIAFAVGSGQPPGRWRRLALAFAAMLVAGGLVVALDPGRAGLVALAFYCIPANSVLPLPHEPGLLYAAQFHEPLAVAIAATAGSTVACIADYALVDAAMRHPRIGPVRDTAVFRWTVRWFRTCPFVIVVLFAFGPLPISPIRIIAPAAGYPIGRYCLAQGIGRFPRFAAFAYLGQFHPVAGWALAASFIVLPLAVLLHRELAVRSG
jgi:membrane protein YqaA with SNARE-associated domain